MSDQVKVEDLEVLYLFRAAMLKFAQAAGQSLSSADSDISRTHSWLEGEQASFWQGQLRKRTEAVVKARDAVRQKKLYKDSSGRFPDASLEEKALKQCLAAVEQAQQKIESIRKWLPKLEKETDLYRGGVVRLNESIASDIPKAVALLDRLAASLQQYVQIESPAGAGTGGADPSALQESVSRGSDGAAQPIAPDATPVIATEPAMPAAVDPPEAPAQKEYPNVADGQ